MNLETIRKSFQPEQPRLWGKKETLWLLDISKPYPTSPGLYIAPFIIEGIIKDQLTPQPVKVDPRANALFQKHGVSLEVMDEIVLAMDTFRYDQPYEYLAYLKQEKLVLDLSTPLKPRVMLPKSHDVHAAGQKKYVNGNCVLFAHHLAFQLHARGITEYIINGENPTNSKRDFFIQDGNCLDLFWEDRMNHWFCSFHFVDASHRQETVVLDPSLRRITTGDRYSTYHGYMRNTEDISIIPHTILNVSTDAGHDSTFTTTAIGCSHSGKIAYGLHFHTNQESLTPLLRLYWDESVYGKNSESFYIDPVTQIPRGDHRVTAAFSLEDRIQLVQCLSMLQKFSFEFGTIQKREDTESFNLRVPY